MRKSLFFTTLAMVIFIQFCPTAFAFSLFQKTNQTPSQTQEVSESRQKIRNYLSNQFSPYKAQGLSVSSISELEAFSEKMPDLPNFMSIKIKDGKVSHKAYGSSDFVKYRVKKVVTLLNKVLAKYKVADLEMVIHLADGVMIPESFSSPVFTCDVANDAPDKKKHFLFPDIYLIRYMLNSKLERMKKEHAKYPWKDKEDKLYFRGSTTGRSYTLENLHKLDRPKLVILSVLYPDIIDARFTKFVQFQNNESQMKAKDVLEKIAPLSPHVPIKDHLKYKYLVSLDGNVGAWGRPLWIMSSNSVLVYHTDYTQWINPAMEPYVHYVPINKELTDIFSAFDWMQKHDDDVKKIIQNANALISNTLNEEAVLDDVAFYLNEYASLCRWSSEGDAKPAKV